MSANQSDTYFQALDAVVPLSPVRRIERKGKKKSTILGEWREIFMEKLAGVDMTGVMTVESVDSSKKSAAVDEQFAEPALVIRAADGTRLVIETQEDFERVLVLIQRLADEPERLLESHLNLFIEPAPPGKVLNSAG